MKPGGYNSLYIGQIKNLLQCCQKPYQQISLDITYRFEVIEEKVKGQVLAMQGSNR